MGTDLTKDRRVAEVFDNLNQMVRNDGGRLELRSFDEEPGILHVSYLMGRNDECETCLINAETMREFLLEALQLRGIRVTDVSVDT